MLIRTFKNQDIYALINLWNTSLPYHQTTMEQVTAILFCDDNFQNEDILIAEEAETIIGFCIGIKRRYPYLHKGLEEGHGWILNIAVAETHRRMGIGSQLLKQMETNLNCHHITLAAYSPYYFFAGVDAAYQEAIVFFEAHHYRRKACAYPMYKNLKDYQMPQEIQMRKAMKQQEGYAFHVFDWNDAKELLDFLSENFSAGWYYHASVSMRNKTATNTIVVCRKHTHMIGYVQSAIDGDCTRYGPFGVMDTYRSQGIGSILVHEMWTLMKQHGADKAWFHSTDEKGRRFYERHGMQVTNTLYHYEKEVLL